MPMGVTIDSLLPQYPPRFEGDSHYNKNRTVRFLSIYATALTVILLTMTMTNTPGGGRWWGWVQWWSAPILPPFMIATTPYFFVVADMTTIPATWWCAFAVAEYNPFPPLSVIFIANCGPHIRFHFLCSYWIPPFLVASSTNINPDWVGEEDPLWQGVPHVNISTHHPPPPSPPNICRIWDVLPLSPQNKLYYWGLHEKVRSGNTFGLKVGRVEGGVYKRKGGRSRGWELI